jgi:hypothetical protein
VLEVILPGVRSIRGKRFPLPSTKTTPEGGHGGPEAGQGDLSPRPLAKVPDYDVTNRCKPHRKRGGAPGADNLVRLIVAMKYSDEAITHINEIVRTVEFELASQRTFRLEVLKVEKGTAHVHFAVHYYE